MGCIDAATEAAELAGLHQAFDAAVNDLQDWQRAEAALALDALRNDALPPLAGFIDAEQVRNMVAVIVPRDWIGIEEAAEIARRSSERVRQWCRSGKLGRRVGGKWMMGRGELEEFLGDRRTRAGRPRKYY
jgi:Helix-turn-helix domain